MLDEVLYPYNRLFGQYKKPDELWGLAAKARERFGARLAASGRRRGGRGRGAPGLRGLRAGHRGAARSGGWKQILADSRVLWIPLQLALRPEQHDTQEELDAILSRAQGTPLVGGNHVFYWNGQQWQLTLHRSILAAQDYHVLWLHDYDGVDHGGDADVIGYYITVEGYLKALTERVREFDRRRQAARLHDPGGPQLLGGKQGTPLHRRPAGPAARTAEAAAAGRGGEPGHAGADVEQALAELREAVAGSKRLQEEAARRGQDWLRQYVSVHLSVMNPADFSYRTNRLIGYLPIAPDTIVRDHRKIIFFDVTELDPGKGAAIFGGVGVGEQYASATWEDRAVRLAGPAALSVKDATRRYLKANGFRDDGHPLPAAAAAQAPRLRRAGQGARSPGLDRHRDGGAQRPRLRAEGRQHRLGRPLHPDAAGQPDRRPRLDLDPRAVGGPAAGRRAARLPRLRDRPRRGERALGRLPAALAHARDLEPLPRSPADPRPRDRARAADGCGWGSTPARGGVNDLEAQLGEMHQTFERYPFLKEDFPFPAEFYARVGRGRGVARRRRLRARDDRLPEDARARSPKLHRKTQLFVTGEALAAIWRRPADPGRDRQPDAVHRQAGDRLRARRAREGADRPGRDLPPLPRRVPRPARPVREQARSST